MFNVCFTWGFMFWGSSKITADVDCSHEVKRRLVFERKVMTNLDSILKNRNITLPTKVHLVEAVVSPIVMYRCGSWTLKLSTVELMLLNCGVGENSWESLVLQGDPTSPSWMFIGRTDTEAETPIVWPCDAKNWLIWEDPDAGKDWRRKEKGTTEDEMVGWHHQFSGRKSEQTLRASEVLHAWRWGSLVCCS